MKTEYIKALDDWYENYKVLHTWERDDTVLAVIKTGDTIDFVRMFGYDASGKVMISIDKSIYISEITD